MGTRRRLVHQASGAVRSTALRHVEGTLFGALTPVMGPVQRTRAQQFATLGATRGAVVFLGDSISEGGLWSEWFPTVSVSNRGIGGETTEQIARRLASAVDAPAAVFVLAGTNDLAAGATPDVIAGRMASMIADIRRRAPRAPVFLQSVMPRKARFAAEIQQINAHYRRIADQHTGVEYVDLWPHLATGASALEPSFTNDSLHLNGNGYAAWVAAIRPLVLRVGRPTGSPDPAEA